MDVSLDEIDSFIWFKNISRSRNKWFWSQLNRPSKQKQMFLVPAGSVLGPPLSVFGLALYIYIFSQTIKYTNCYMQRHIPDSTKHSQVSR